MGIFAYLFFVFIPNLSIKTISKNQNTLFILIFQTASIYSIKCKF
ncbi:hypothetical protein NEIFLAOT_01632 [Neisseria flavescens NRL30031/H210]|uniref:Uncharacterized protein n=1 Tax=Neisseria flavescens NRL30031/H210 TaxID=546264 RepID=C0ENU5_NEIFL|nr:hypothetical protein NEIFLAOT_01632 [Neisseria flavescens NRL30031/H210]